MRITVPGVSLSTRGLGVQNLLSKINPAWLYEGRVDLDFSNCNFLAAEAVSILAGLVLFRMGKGQATFVLQDSLATDVRKNLWKMGFLDLFGVGACSYTSNSLPLYHRDTEDAEALIEYIDRELMSREEMPTMSKALQKEIRRSFVEIFGNVFYHSHSPIGGLVCGQIYPKGKEIQFTFYDAGIGIGAKVRSCVPTVRNDADAICWALERGTSTLALAEGHPRGLGLYLLRKFLKVNDGTLQVYANKGYFREQSGRTTSSEIGTFLSGTLIDLRIRIKGGVSYKFSDE
jgi:hypothetical protein